MGARNFADLIVWQKASALESQIFKVTERFPQVEQFRLVDQMRTAAASIPANIAEGFGRWSSKDQARFYSIAKTSGDELKVHLKHSNDRGYGSDLIDLLALTDEVCAMLYRLRERVIARGSGR